MTDPIPLLEKLNRSGHLLHLRTFQTIKKVFRFHPQTLSGPDHQLLVAPYYQDPLSKVPREIDLVYKRNLKRKDGADCVLRIFIECKYLVGDKEVVFLKEKIDSIEKLINSRMSDDISPFLLRDLRYTRFLEEGKIAVLCEPFKDLFDGVDTLLKASTFDSSGGVLNLDFLFIVVKGSSADCMFVCQGENWQGDFKQQDLKPTMYEILQVNYFQSNMLGSRKVLVEFIHEDNLENILRDLINELRVYGIQI